MFRIGQRVVRIEHNLPRLTGDSRMPRITIGTILTIREIETRGLKYGHEAATLRFQEITGVTVKCCEGIWELGYDARCFRPVTEHKTDISIFTKILDDVKAGKVSEIAK